MAADEIHVDDIGVRFTVTIKDGEDIVDVSSASLKQLLFQRPNGSILTKTASLFSDGTDGIIIYTTTSGDLSEAGNWKLQGYVEFGSSHYHSDVVTFRVHRNIS